LHFEDLEPHRFEDLVRQLVYDFRPWHGLEATGRMGSDEGVDIRGLERVASDDSSSEDLDEDATSSPSFSDRVWIIQCKREKTVPPSKIRAIVKESVRSLEEPPYGFLLVAATDFSVKAREFFREEMRTRGIQEFALWGKAELEDRLFEPRHDHLLFAYFGVSLQSRRRGFRSIITSRLTTKRRLVKALGDVNDSAHHDVLLRDSESEQYPHPQDETAFRLNPLWRYYRFSGHLRVDQLAFVVREHWAWIKPDERKWDVLEEFDQGFPRDPELYAGMPRRKEETLEREEQARRFWTARVPDSEQAYLRTLGFVHYDRVVALDDVGDRFHPPPHLLLACARPNELFDDLLEVIEQGYGDSHRMWRARDLTRAQLFPSPVTMTPEEFFTELDKRHR